MGKLHICTKSSVFTFEFLLLQLVLRQVLIIDIIYEVGIFETESMGFDINIADLFKLINEDQSI